MAFLKWLKRNFRYILYPLIICALIGLPAWYLFKSETPSSKDNAGNKDNDKEKQVYSCSMCPQVMQPDPGLCPICGMDLIPINKDDIPANLPAEQVALSKEAKILAGIRTTLVRKQDEPGSNIRLLGRIETAESNLRAVTAWTAGRIDKLHVNKTGQKIGKGRVVATIYSPEIFSAHQDLLLASKQLNRISGGMASAVSSAGSAVDSIKERLRLLGVPDSDIARMEKAKGPWRQVPIRSPFFGTVLERSVTEGTYVSVGTPLYKLANLSVMWVQLDAYESDLPSLSLKQSVTLEVESYPDEVFEGKINFIDPTLDPAKRTAQVRVEVKNKKGKLKPGMFVEALVKAANVKNKQERLLLIPKTAPLFTGRRSVVYVEVDNPNRPTYEARVVRLGPLQGNFYPVVAGLASGEKVVTKGAFVLDADLQIRGGASMMKMADDTQQGTFDEIIKINKKQLKKFVPVFDHYLAVQQNLADDDLNAAKANGKLMSKAAAKLKLTKPIAAVQMVDGLVKIIKQHAGSLAASESIEVARADFEFLSAQLANILTVFGNPQKDLLYKAHCPMAFGNRGAYWFQKSDTIANSYFGASMLKCGTIQTKIPSGSYLKSETQTTDADANPMEGHQH